MLNWTLILYFTYVMCQSLFRERSGLEPVLCFTVKIPYTDTRWLHLRDQTREVAFPHGSPVHAFAAASQSEEATGTLRKEVAKFTGKRTCKGYALSAATSILHRIVGQRATSSFGAAESHAQATRALPPASAG